MNKQIDSKETENKPELYTLLGVVTSDEITSIDRRIKSCMIENKEEPDDEIYVKVWFNYKMGNDPLKTDGRQEFVADTKETLIKEIQDFFKVSKNGWCIL